MADYNYGGSEEENAELRKLEVELVCLTWTLMRVPVIYIVRCGSWIDLSCLHLFS